MNSQLLLPFLRSASMALGLLSPLAAGQATWVVNVDGSADFSSIQAAIDAASEGDLILVEDTVVAGQWLRGFTIDGKSLTLQGRGDVHVQTLNTFGLDQGDTFTVRNLASGQSVSVRGISFFQVGGYSDRTASLRNCAGAVLIEDCVFRGYDGRVFEVDSCASVTLTRTELIAPKCQLVKVPPSSQVVQVDSPGLIAGLSNLWIYDSEILGGDGYVDTLGFGVPGVLGAGEGILLSDSRLFASGTRIVGGSSPDVPYGCFAGGAGGAGIQTLTNSSVRLLDSVVLGGSGGAGICGAADGLDAPAFDVQPGELTLLPGIARSNEVVSPTTAGSPLQLGLQGAPFDFALAIYSLGTAPALEFSGLSGVLHLSGPIGLLHLGALPASGQLSVSVGSLGLPPAARGFRLVGQVLFTDGVDIFEGGPSELLILDPSL